MRRRVRLQSIRSAAPEGILVQASGNGHLSLLVTCIDYRTAVNDKEWRKVA